MSKALQREFLLSLECNGDEKTANYPLFVELMRKFRSRSESHDLAELVQSLPKKQHQPLWELAHQAVILLTSEGRHQNEENPEDHEHVLAVLHGVILLGLEFLNSISESCESLTETVLALHNIMFDCQTESGFDLQNNLARLCMKWYQEERPQKEQATPQTFLFLLIQSLELSARKVDVARVFQMRECFALFDLDDESSDMLKHILLRCFINPLYLKTLEGRKFLAQVMIVDIK